MDAHSKWPEIYPTTSITASRTVEILSDIFARFGIPEIIVTDNGTQFTSEIFQTFCSSNGITHLRSPPFHPSSNGQAERFVDTFKRGLQKLTAGGSIQQHLPVFLQHYRATPNAHIPNQLSPAEALLGRPMRTVLDLLKPPRPRSHGKSQIALNQELQYNRKHGVKARHYRATTPVYVKTYSNNKWKWTSGTIVERLGRVLYVVLLDSEDCLIRAHVNQLRLRTLQETEASRTQLPLDVLLETFDIPIVEQPHAGTPNNQPVLNPALPAHLKDNSEPAYDGDTTPASRAPAQPLRRSTRTRCSPQRYGDCVRY